MEKHALSRLIGSPPGYVGFDEGGQLTEKVRRRPYSVVLFDEIEKAHEELFNLLLQILDDGRLTDSQGRTVDFKNTVIVMTSNAGRQNGRPRSAMGFSGQDAAQGDDAGRRRAAVMEELKKTFRPEFLNRIADIILFRALDREDMRAIAGNMLGGVRGRAARLGVTLEYTPEALETLVSAGFDPVNGARPLQRLIREKVEDPLAEHLLGGALRAGDRAVLTADGDGIAIRRESAPETESTQTD